MDSNLHLWILPVLPLVGAAINGFFGKGRSRSFIGGVACTTVGLAFLYAVYLFFTAGFSEHPIIETVGPWIGAGSFHAAFSFYLDPLSMLMTLIVTGVGFLIHVYSTGYMEDDGLYRFFSYLNLFTFFMLTLVLAGNYLLMFVGWEGVGLCSYLLIGFYYLKKSAADAGKKAFIVNRVGDFGFTLAMLLIVGTFGSLDFTKRFCSVPKRAGGERTGRAHRHLPAAVAGACGKSAQVPLYVWLPDAMEGPTPVSALIHAATMVTAGVYMVARSSPLFAACAAGHGIGGRYRLPHRAFSPPPSAWCRTTSSACWPIHGQPARIHVPGLRRRRVLRRHFSPDDPRLLQSAAVPRGGQRDARDERRTGHAQDGWASPEDSRNLLDRAPGHARDLAACRRSPDSSARTKYCGAPRHSGHPWLWLGGDDHRGHDRLLHVPRCCSSRFSESRGATTRITPTNRPAP